MATDKDFKVKNGLQVDTDTLVVDATNDRVGINKASPSYTLDIDQGFIRVQSPDVSGVTPPSLVIGQMTNGYQAGVQSGSHITLKTTSTTGNFYFYKNSSPLFSVVDSNANIHSGNLQIGGTDVITSARQLTNLSGHIRSDSVFQFLTTGGSAQNVRVKSLFASTSYTDTPPAGSINATNTYELDGTTVINSSRALTNITGITSTGAFKSSGGDSGTSGQLINAGGSAVNQTNSGTLRLTERTYDVSPYYQGAFVKYDGSANKLLIGTHAGTSQALSDDVNAIEIGRGSTTVDFQGAITATGNLTVDTNTFHVDATNNRIGIGTTSPSTSLHINEGSPTIRIQDTDGTNQYTQIGHASTATYFGARNDTADGNIIFGGYGGGSFTEFARFNSSGHLSTQGNITVGGNLTVNGTTTTIDTTNTNVKDNNITLNYSTGDSSATANNAGITIQDAVDASTDATLLWDSTNDKFDFSHSIQVPDNANVKVGSDGDLFMVHNGTNSFIQNKVGDLYIENASDDKDIIFRSDDGSGGLAEYFRLDGSEVQNRFSKHVKISDNQFLRIGTGNDLTLVHDTTNSTIKNNTGDLYIENTADDKDIIFRSDDGSGGLATYFFIDGSASLTKFNVDTKHLDSVKAIFGDSSDLQIYHDGSNSYIDDAGTGHLFIRANNLRLQKYTGETYLNANADGATGIYYDGAEKIVTTATGVDVTGAITSTSGVSRFQGGLAVGADNDIYFYESSAGNGTIRTGSSGAYKYTTLRSDGDFDIQNGGLRIGSTEVITNARNLENIGTVSSGAITSTGSSTFDRVTDNNKKGRYTSLTGSSGDWFPILNLSNASNGPVFVSINTYAHSGATFTASTGYTASNSASLTVLTTNYNTNNTYANLAGLRIRSNGVVEAKLVWASGPSVDIDIYVTDANQHTISFPASLATTTDTNTVQDSHEWTVTGLTSARKLNALNAFSLGGTTVIDSNRDLTNIGAITGSGNISVTTASSPSLALQDTTNNVIFKSYAQDSNAFTGTTSNHTLNIGTNNTAAITLDTSQNATFAGNITAASGNIQAGNATTGKYVRAHYSDGSYMTLQGYGLEMNRTTSYIRPTTDGNKTLHFGAADSAALDWAAIHFRSLNGLYMTGTRFLTTDRNLENIGTISSGAITSSASMTINTTGSGQLSLQRSGTTRIRSDQSGSNGGFVYTGSGGNTWTAGAVGNDFVIADNAYMGDGTGTTVLTLDTSANATFAGNVDLTSTHQLSISGQGGFRGVNISGTAPGLYLDDTDVNTAWHLGANGDFLYVLEDTDSSGAYNEIRARWNASQYEQYSGHINIRSGALKMGSGAITVIDSLRNLVNIAQLSSTGSHLVAITSGVGVGGTPADANSAELGAGFLNLARDDTALAKQIQFAKNGAVHSYFATQSAEITYNTTSGRHTFALNGSSAFNISTTGVFSNNNIQAPNFNASTGGYQIGGTSVISSARNLTNIVSITASGDLKLTTPSVGTRNIIFDENGSDVIGIKYSGNVSGNPLDIHNFQGAGTTLVRVLESGNVGIGKTPSVKLDVNGQIRGSGQLELEVDGNDKARFTDDQSNYIEMDGGAFEMDFALDGTVQARLYDNGNLHINGTLTQNSTQVPSDIKLKKNITPIDNALSLVGKLKGVHFDWRKDDKKAIGFIAQEVEEVLPELVSEVSELHNREEKHKTVDYQSVIPVLVEAIKEQQRQIKALQKQLNNI